MKLQHFNPGELSYEAIHRFVVEYAHSYPIVFGSLDPDERAHKLHTNAHVIAELDIEGKLVAAAFFYSNDSVNHIAFLTSIAKLPGASKGVGGQLLAAYEEYAKQMGMTSSRFEVGSANNHAQNFYLLHGYQKEDEFTGKIVFEKQLGESKNENEK